MVPSSDSGRLQREKQQRKIAESGVLEEAGALHAAKKHDECKQSVRESMLQKRPPSSHFERISKKQPQKIDF
ncbi:hypothetical protein P4637_06510 [Halalkalibacterium halodurans]|uniref:hypothetical protein n=1 Tax=Halalkalibacterium halodurans TaxID=86665 RepID=UPI002E1E3307|nr:hypothetical protein [Halalkalibacterium halodurans]MED4084516.1 hypothetical protein [Halalkalibacterium halodurans]MED4103710.1 hypothetical protein [Halalkalibacterium halodurans]MED4110178.1 hypothetical protein [Halalkalibacterium halodurans]MED4147884.1 hypothetical protein [Halalkalibacterium halodurans]